MSTKTPAGKKARALQKVFGADPALCNLAYCSALQWVRAAGMRPWNDWDGFVAECKAKADRVQL